MWLCLGILAYGASAALATPQSVNNARFEWGWKLQTPPSGGHPVAAGQYYVRLPESSGAGAEQRVSYQADGSGYHGAVAVATRGQHHTHEHTFALGRPALMLLHNQAPALAEISNTMSNPGTVPANNGIPPELEIYLLQQQFSSPSGQGENSLQILQNPVHNVPTQFGIPNYFANNILSTPAQYVVDHTMYKPVDSHNQQNVLTTNENDSSTPLPKEARSEQTREESHETDAFNADPVQVFKDHNCTNEDNGLVNLPKSNVNYQQSAKLFAEIPSYDQRKVSNRGNYGAKISSSYSDGNMPRKVDERQNSRSERIYVIKPNNQHTTTMNDLKTMSEEGISKLVASTQDLISNEDLLIINHAVEKDGYVHNDDILKAKSNFQLRPEQSRRHDSYTEGYNGRDRFTVKAKLTNIVANDGHHTEENGEQILQTSSNGYNFATPIVVQDSTVNDFKDQIMHNILSTITPYLEDGYELKSVKNTLDEDVYNSNLQRSNSSDINAKSRPISQRYLAAITVGLRLLNSNDTDVLNSVDDHEGSDSEIISDTVESPKHERTVVEIQESVPLGITHINDVVVHEWDDNENKNAPFKITKSLYNQYNEALESSRKIQQHMNKNQYRHNVMNHHQEHESTEENAGDQNNEDIIKPSENTQSEIQAEPSNYSHERRKFEYNNSFGEKIIQPIIIEKEVPVTKYVDRFIEKQVPYPERVEVIKEVEKQVPVPVPYQTIVEKPVEVTKYVDRPQPYPVQVHHQVPVEVKVPYPVEKKVYIDRPVHIPVPIEKVVEKAVVHPIAVPTAVAVPYEVRVPVEHRVPYPVTVEKQVPVETIVERQVAVPYPVEKRVPYPVPYETRIPVPYPVEKIVDRPITITKYVERPVHIQVPVPHPVAVPVHVHHPYPVDRIVERKVPYPVQVDRIVEKKVEVPVNVPVEKLVEKIVEKPVVITKYVDKPYPVERRVPYPVDRIVEKKVPYPVQVPVEVKVPYPVEKIIEKQVHVPFKVPYYVEKSQKAPYTFERPQYYLPQLLQQKYAEHHNNLPASNNQAAVYKTQQQQSPNQNVPQYLQFNKVETDKDSKKVSNPPVKTTAWGNLYASTYQYINNTPEHHKANFKKTPTLNKYIGYVTNTSPDQYYGPPPMETASYYNTNNMPRNYLMEFKLRRADRTPKVANLRIEYGGFKPPLVPSTEVDLDGIPVNREEEKN